MVTSVPSYTASPVIFTGSGSQINSPPLSSYIPNSLLLPIILILFLLLLILQQEHQNQTNANISRLNNFVKLTASRIKSSLIW